MALPNDKGAPRMYPLVVTHLPERLRERKRRTSNFEASELWSRRKVDGGSRKKE